MNREEYLKQKLIPNITYTISDEEVRIDSMSTTFVHCKMPEKVRWAYVDRLFHRLRCASKGKKITIRGLNKAKTRMKECIEGYEKTFDEIKTLFKELVEVAGDVKKDGIHYTYSNDEKLEKVILLGDEIRMKRLQGYEYSVFLNLFIRIQQAICQVEEIKENEKAIIYIYQGL